MGERGHVDTLHVAIDTNHRRNASGQVQVRGVILHGESEELGDVDGHAVSLEKRR
jgi:hypothetical protein